MMMTLQQAHAMLPGSRLVGDGNAQIIRVHTDTRSLKAGDLFVALKGENFDANTLLPAAKAAGAVAAIAHDGLAAVGLSGLEVDDSLVALGQLATAWRAQFKLPVIAVTGSNGKTTVTQMTASILRAFQGDAAFATQGNFNNAIGVPLTLLGLRAEHRIAVIELGMNHPGEIAYLANMVKPTVALVNNAQREHLEFMHTVQAVAEENGSVMASLTADGIAVYPAEDAYAAVWQQGAGIRAQCRFGDKVGEVCLLSAQWVDSVWVVHAHTPLGDVQYMLHIAGRHNVSNSLAAIACSQSAGVGLAAIAQGLSAFEPVKGRSRVIALRGLTLIDDTYNANPDSMRAAIDVLADLPGPRVLVMGDMGEVGAQGPAFHAEAGAYARSRGIETLLCLGDLSAHAGGQHFVDVQALQDAVLQQLGTARSVLVKGSRFMKMERLVKVIQDSKGAAC